MHYAAPFAQSIPQPENKMTALSETDSIAAASNALRSRAVELKTRITHGKLCASCQRFILSNEIDLCPPDGHQDEHSSSGKQREDRIHSIEIIHSKWSALTARRAC
jgi:hypothetical protein